MFGITNTAAQISGFLNPTIIAYLVPNVSIPLRLALRLFFICRLSSFQGTQEEWQNVFYVAAAISVIGGGTYVIWGSSELQPWAQKKPVARGTPTKAAKTHPLTEQGYDNQIFVEDKP